MYYSNNFPPGSKLKLFQLLNIIFFLLVSGSMLAQIKPKVNVQFRMLYSEYADYYQNDVASINTSVSDTLSNLLNQSFPFIQFGAEGAGDTLLVTLDREIHSDPQSITVPTEFRMVYKRKDKFKKEFKQAEVFREAGQALEGLPDDKNVFVSEIRSALIRWLDRNDTEMLTDVFSNVRICNNPYLVASEKKWVMPFSMKEMQIGLQSELQVDTQVQGPLGKESCPFASTVTGEATQGVPQKYKGKIFCSIMQPDNVTECLQKVTNASIQGVYLKKFERLFLAETDPSTFSFTH